MTATLVFSATPAAARDAAASAVPAAVEAGPVQGPRRAARLAATDKVVRATILRVDGAGVHAPGPRLADYRIRPGTEQPLRENLLQELVKLVRAADGFDDSIHKRCRPGVSVGFRLVHMAAEGATAPPPSELVLDFGCNKLVVGNASADPAARASYFDPSRAAFMGLSKRALPSDPEIGRLR